MSEPVEKIKLKAGTYKLQYSVKNPDVDRRIKHDWRRAVEWQAGKVFIVEVDSMITDMVRDHLIQSGVDIAKIPEESFLRVHLRPADGGFGHQNLPDSSDAFQALAPNLTLIDETTNAMLSRLGIHRQCNDWKFFTFLCKKYGNAWFEAHWDEYHEQMDDQ